MLGTRKMLTLGGVAGGGISIRNRPVSPQRAREHRCAQGRTGFSVQPILLCSWVLRRANGCWLGPPGSREQGRRLAMSEVCGFAGQRLERGPLNREIPKRDQGIWDHLVQPIQNLVHSALGGGGGGRSASLFLFYENPGELGQMLMMML